MYVVELTVCFEPRFNMAHNLKTSKYVELVKEARGNQYTCNLVTLEVGCRGPFHLPGYKALQPYIPVLSKESNCLLVQMTETFIKSHRI